VNIERRWNDADRRNPKDSEKNLSQCHFVHHNSTPTLTALGAKPGLRGDKSTTNRLSCMALTSTNLITADENLKLLVYYSTIQDIVGYNFAISRIEI
jgi:hypothetical protein